MRQGIHQTGSHGRLGTAGYTDRTDVEFDSVAEQSVDDSGQVVDQSADGLRRWNFVDQPRQLLLDLHDGLRSSHALQYSARAPNTPWQPQCRALVRAHRRVARQASAGWKRTD